MNPPNGQNSLDYLNQIAPAPQKSSGFQVGLNLKTIILGGIAAIIVVIALVAIVGIINSGKAKGWQELPARLAFTSTVADDAAKNIKNSRLRTYNSDLRIYLTNTQRDLDAQLATRHIDAKKLPKNISAAENDTAMTDRLEVGRLNAKYDSTYAREMSYKLSTILALLSKMYAQGGSTTTKTFLEKAYTDLLPTQKAIADFNASNE